MNYLVNMPPVITEAIAEGRILLVYKPPSKPYEPYQARMQTEGGQVEGRGTTLSDAINALAAKLDAQLQESL